MKFIIYEEDKSVTVVSPAYSLCVDEENIEDFLNKIALKVIPKGLSYFFIENTEMPTLFREAWKISEEKIIIDMEKAREIKMNEIRELRSAKLAELDIEELKVMRKKDKIQLDELYIKKERLCDLPATYDLLQFVTAEELAEALPEELA